jgi:hypothetical protein
MVTHAYRSQSFSILNPIRSARVGPPDVRFGRRRFGFVPVVALTHSNLILAPEPSTMALSPARPGCIKARRMSLAPARSMPRKCRSRSATFGRLGFGDAEVALDERMVAETIVSLGLVGMTKPFVPGRDGGVAV